LDETKKNPRTGSVSPMGVTVTPFGARDWGKPGSDGGVGEGGILPGAGGKPPRGAALPSGGAGKTWAPVWETTKKKGGPWIRGGLLERPPCRHWGGTEF